MFTDKSRQFLMGKLLLPEVHVSIAKGVPAKLALTVLPI